MWVLAGCLGLVVIACVAAVSAGWYFAHKARQAGVDPELMRRNPTLAMTKLLTAINPDIEVLDVDEGRGTVTVRKKSTGKTVTLNFDDVKRGKIVIEGDDGQKVSIGGDRWDPPEWAPTYPGAKTEHVTTAVAGGSETGTGTFTTSDSASDVVRFYESAFKKYGLDVTKQTVLPGVGTIEGRDDSGRRHVSVTATPADGITRIVVNYATAK
jgi:hypothetical protein